MKLSRFSLAVLACTIALAFFACSDNSPNSSNSDEYSSSGHGGISSNTGNNGFSSGSDNGGVSSGSSTAGINPQVYIGPTKQQCDKEYEVCISNAYNSAAPFTGNGVLKNIVREYNDNDELTIMDISNVGTITNGKINLELRTPTYLIDDNMHSLFELMLYDNTDKVIGQLMMVSFHNLDDISLAYYVYSAEDMEDKDSYDLFPNQNVIFVYDLEWKRGWNLFYENDRYSIINNERTLTLTRTTNPSILNGGELKWFLFDPDEF